MRMEMRQALFADVDAILSIWLQRPGADTDDDRTRLMDHHNDFAQRIDNQDDVFKFWVATQADACVGWSSLQRMRSSPSLKETMAEWSIYISSTSLARGVGSELAMTTIEHAKQSSLEWILGFVAQTNGPCIGLFERLGFNRLGKFPETKGNPKRPEVILFVLDVS
jgi:L-amino acid N-acyltransferase YncA